MTSEQGAAYVVSQSICAMIEAMGMQAVNQSRTVAGLTLQYTKEDFDALIVKYGIHHNAVHGYIYHDPPSL